MVGYSIVSSANIGEPMKSIHVPQKIKNLAKKALKFAKYVPLLACPFILKPQIPVSFEVAKERPELREYHIARLQRTLNNPAIGRMEYGEARSAKGDTESYGLGKNTRVYISDEGYSEGPVELEATARHEGQHALDAKYGIPGFEDFDPSTGYDPADRDKIKDVKEVRAYAAALDWLMADNYKGVALDYNVKYLLVRYRELQGELPESPTTTIDRIGQVTLEQYADLVQTVSPYEIDVTFQLAQEHPWWRDYFTGAKLYPNSECARVEYAHNGLELLSYKVSKEKVASRWVVPMNKSNEPKQLLYVLSRAFSNDEYALRAAVRFYGLGACKHFREMKDASLGSYTDLVKSMVEAGNALGQIPAADRKPENPKFANRRDRFLEAYNVLTSAVDSDSDQSDGKTLASDALNWYRDLVTIVEQI
jgi:hypothetical protein